MAEEEEKSTDRQLLSQLANALAKISQGDPLVSLRTELRTQFDAIESRFTQNAEATKLLHDDQVRVPTLVDRAFDNLKHVLTAEMRSEVNSIAGKIAENQAISLERFNGAIGVVNEKITSLGNVTTQQFKSIDDKFAEKDKAVSVGLSAQKESAAAAAASNDTATKKMEDNFTTLLSQGRDLLNEFRRNTEIQIGDIKSRLDKGEGKSGGNDANNAWIMAAVMLIITVGGVIVAAFHH